MYLRVIRNRGQKKNKYIVRLWIAIIGLILINIVTNICLKTVKVVDYKNIVSNKCEEVLLKMYKLALSDGYSIKNYKNISRKDESITTIVNRNSNLYLYMVEENLKIDVVFSDPSYTYGHNDDTMLVSEKEDDFSKENAVDESDISVDKEVAETGSGEGLKDYIPPAVSKEGIRYTTEQLTDFSFLMSKLYVVPARAKVLEEELNGSEMLGKDMTLKQDNSKPQILVYHTHSQEGFADSVKGKPETYIVGVGDYLCKLLSEEYGYNVIHCRETFDIRDGVLDRSKAYTYAEQTITQILEDNPTIEVVIDLHRDGLKEGADKLVTTVDGKEVAKIMFFNGVSRSSASGDIDYLYNRYKKDNLAFSFQLKLAAMECYPEYTRKNYIDAYQYNQHLRPKSVLVEAGAQNNTLQEELNSMEVLAEILHRVIK